MSKTLLQLKVVNATERNIPAPRLCDLCANGAVLRGHARAPESAEIAKEEVICLFLGRVIEIDVTECNRYVDRFPSPGNDGAQAISQTAWVA